MATKKMVSPKASGSVKQRVQKDEAYDRGHGIKENSAADKKMDRKMGITNAEEKKYGRKGK